jgi:beta-glucosidase
MKKALKAARTSDLSVFFAGEESILAGEAHSLADISLKGAQSKLIEQLAATGKPLVLVVMAGRPLTIGREVEQSAAVLYAWHPGTMGGPAIAELLFGERNPCGKLPVSLPRMTGQIPVHYNHHPTGRPASGKEMLLYEIERGARQTSTGMNSFYLDAGSTPLFPFGFGLSYTNFTYSGLKTDKGSYRSSDTIRIEFELKNEGAFSGVEVAQMYVSDVAGSIARPVRELKRFQRMELQPAERKVLHFELPVSELAFYGIDGTEKVETGEFRIMVGTNSVKGLVHTIRVTD